MLQKKDLRADLVFLLVLPEKGVNQAGKSNRESIAFSAHACACDAGPASGDEYVPAAHVRASANAFAQDQDSDVYDGGDRHHGYGNVHEPLLHVDACEYADP